MTESESQPSPHAAEQSSANGRPVILIADDDFATRIFLKRVCTSLEFEVLEVENGKQAVDKYAELGALISLVVMDVIMPVLDGESAMKSIRKQDPKAKILMISGETDSAMKDSLINEGATAFLAKPLDTITLASALRSLVQ